MRARPRRGESNGTDCAKYRFNAIFDTPFSARNPQCATCLFLFPIAITACGSSDPAPPALLHYVAAQEALASDDLDQARQALQDLVQSASPTTQTVGGKSRKRCRYYCGARCVQAAVRGSAEGPNPRGLRLGVLPNGRRRQRARIGCRRTNPKSPIPTSALPCSAAAYSLSPRRSSPHSHMIRVESAHPPLRLFNRS